MSEMNFLGLGHLIYLCRIVVQPYDGNVNFLLIFQTITGHTVILSDRTLKKLALSSFALQSI